MSWREWWPLGKRYDEGEPPGAPPLFPGDPSDAYEDPLVAALLGRSQFAAKANPDQLAAVEASASMVSRAFALAELSPSTAATRAVSPALLAMVGRAFIAKGEFLAVIEADPMTGLVLHPASHWDVQGGHRRETWRYRADLQGPSRQSSVSRPYSSVLHPRINVEAAKPWRGQSPITKAGLSAGLAAQAEKILTAEAKIPPSRIAPHPGGSGDNAADSLKDFLSNLRSGGITGFRLGHFAQADGMTPGSALAPQRVGADPAAGLVSLRSDAAGEIFSATGVPIELFRASDGTGAREAYRRFLFNTVLPWAELIAEELADKLDAPGLALKFDRLFASDLSGRARAFQSMTGGGMEVAKAAALSGLMAMDD